MDIEQRVEALLKHADVWDETKETLRELLAEHKAGTLDPEDARYIDGLHQKVFGGRGMIVSAANATPHGTRDVPDVKADNDETDAAAPSGPAAGDLIAALREDIAAIVTPTDMPEAEQALRRDILAAINAKLDDYDTKAES